ncbi:cysteine--tRNA ligase [Brasilonema octagenarum UFV-E1]|uniref:Cysteine--tRNA ligase n=1 Tax=Brasilonema sennae CENA114 TaxID=415709 RepID=A0A856MDY6_9CYAN|nr:cysteine--tRNA ligase [Brasilonema sennae]QDL08534.1 cysteine--tRNA ligase [Brasilonema sennae CENA114]QDL14889.1 cysteine--tRNA ligase [Brasilonema octagenarum UFV-E1]
MTLTLYNTLTRRQESFQTVEPGKVKMYCCGVTVYDYCHLGHARSYIVWDTIRRYLQWRGYQVHYIQNFTDIDDKILNRAREQGSTMEAVANRFIDAYFEDIRRLNVMDADEYPRATENIPAIIELIDALEEKDYAYAVGGDVYYRVERFPAYGKLSGQQLDQKQAGASGRVDSEDSEAKKQHPFDFALWKAAKPGEPAWDSPWGKGRPGWHIECSAMIRETLGTTIDIHGGGRDLINPHHENEIAQSEAATNQPLARYWMHNGMVMVDGAKMSKSLGNFITIRELLDGVGAHSHGPVDPMAVRLFVLQAHYRKPLDFTEQAIATASAQWKTLKEGLLFGYVHGEKLAFAHHVHQLDKGLIQEFETSGDDDFNFSKSLAVLFELSKKLQREGNLLVHEGKTETPPVELQKEWYTLVTLAQVLGLEAKQEVETPQSHGISDAEIEAFIQKRQDARKAKNFAEADRIRNELQAKGIILIDSREGSKWHRN